MTNSGDYNKTEVYFYDGQRIVETRDGSANVVSQFIHGTQYIDELVMMRVKDKGDLYVHQDANWNVIGTTDLGRHVVERSVYTPYGELTVHQDTGFGDRDGDQEVDSTDKGTVGTTCTGTVSGSCRILDLDFDGDYDSTDATKFDALTQGPMRHPGRPSSNVSQPFAHQGLLFEPELAQYQNRARQYDPGKRRFAQRDPLAMQPVHGSGYHDGMNLLGYVSGNPPTIVDPSGTKNTKTCGWLEEHRAADCTVTAWSGALCSLYPNSTIEEIAEDEMYLNVSTSWNCPPGEVCTIGRHSCMPPQRLTIFHYVSKSGCKFTCTCVFRHSRCEGRGTCSKVR